jgi:hypothetical protein
LLDVARKPGVKYLFIYRHPDNRTMLGGADSLSEIDGILHEKGLPFHPHYIAVLEVPESIELQAVVNDIGDIIDAFFGIKGDRMMWTPH